MPKQDYYLPPRQLVSQQDAAIIERPQIPRSTFIGSWNHKTAFDAGLLIPFMVEEVLPGDHLTYDVTAYVRMSTPLFPLFDSQRIDTFFFFVPNRIIWEHWPAMMGEQQSPTDSIAYLVPTCESANGGYAVGSLQDHMGIPGIGQIDAGLPVIHNNLPMRAYNRIYQDWFRDENITGAVTLDFGDGPDNRNNYILLPRAKSHDYFTSVLPWPQKFTAPTIPFSGTAPISGLGVETPGVGIAATSWYETARGLVNYPGAQSANLGTPNRVAVEVDSVTGLPLIYADLSQATGVAINTFRQAFLVQQLLERDARGGTRYVELIKSHFGVTNPDFRMQRPEYIGGGQTPLTTTPIAQTAPSAGVPVGALGAATTGAGSHRASYAATEHGYIIAIINIRTELSYQQGLHRMWSRSSRYDFYWPSLAGLGEQAVLRKEIYLTGNVAGGNTVFGYQEHWHEYRTRVSEVTGIMRSTAAGTLDAWHLAQSFSAAPTLNTTFLADTPPMTRVLAAGSAADGQQYLADIHIKRRAVRPIPTYGTPVKLGRF